MKWASAISRKTAFDNALSECADTIRAALDGDRPDIVFAFVTPHFAARYDDLQDIVSASLSPTHIVGCSGGGVLGAGREVEFSPAVSIVAACLPDVSITPVRIDGEARLPDLDGSPDAWRNFVGVSPEDEPDFILLCDPYSSRTGALLSGLDFAYPDAAKVGGLVSGGTSPGTNSLFLDGSVYDGGSVGVALSGDVRVDTVVAQGCRPIGELATVTACEGNYLYGLDGVPALDAVRELFSELDPGDLRLAQSALFAGVLMDEFTEDPGPGEFLIRNIIGIDPSRGTIVVGERLQTGMRLRFHVRDARTSADDLRLLLDLYSQSVESPPEGVLMFSCLGRGANLYGEPDFDSGILSRHVGAVPVGGFFCNGEIGPVSGATFLHGYTSSLALFRSRD